IQCLNNERQLTLSWKMAVEDDGDGKFGGPSTIDWFVNQVGLVASGWDCPSAPVVTNDQRQLELIANGAIHKWGLVNRAWFDTGGPLYFGFPSQGEYGKGYGLFRNPPPLNGPRERSGGYGLNSWLTFSNDSFNNIMDYELVRYQVNNNFYANDGSI